jgi:Protein of unknown function (DUF1588)
MPRTRKLAQHLGPIVAISVAAVGALGFAGCSDGDAEAGCVTTEQYFAEQVWAPVMSQKCVACHNPQGLAKDSKMVLKGSSEAGFLDANLAIVREVAAFDRDGTSLLLLKPTATVSHGGGVVIAQDGPEYQALAELVNRLKENAPCETSVTGFHNGVNLGTPNETLRKAALSLAGRLPTAAEEAEVQAGGEPALRNAIDRLMNEETFYIRLKEIYNDLFLTDRYIGDAGELLNNQDYYDPYWFESVDPSAGFYYGIQGDVREGLRRRTNLAVAREPLELIVHVARENRPFSEILTADYFMVNPFSAKAYTVTDVTFDNPADPLEWKEARIADIPHAGVLTSPMFLNRFPTTETNRNRARARYVYQFFLGTDILKTGEQPLDPTKVTGTNPTRENPSCTVCHSVIDPVAGAFHNFDAQAAYDPENAWYEEMVLPGFGQETIPEPDFHRGLQWLAPRLAEDARFRLSVVYALYQGLVGQKPLLAPADPAHPDFAHQFKAYLAQYTTFSQIAEQFKADNYNVKSVARGIIMSPYYRAKNAVALTPERVVELNDVGTARFLIPEQLNRKVKAVLGIPWRWQIDDSDLLLNGNEYRIFYGGIDSDGVTQRILEPNGIMANVAERMANEMACWSVARDFAKPKDQRLLFPKVEVSFEPEDINKYPIEGAVQGIKENIVHLHKHVLGETLDIADPEIERTYQLFLETWREGSAGVKAGQGEENPMYRADLPWACTATEDYYTRMPLSEDDAIWQDEGYTIRAWMAVVTYLLSDYSFIHE